MDMLAYIVIAVIFILTLVIFAFMATLYRKVEQGMALVKNGVGGTKVTFSGMVVWPVVHKAEMMEISVKRIEIYRHGEDGLVCRDNIRADIKVAFFVRVNKTEEDVLKVAQSVGCARASEQKALVELFDAKFSEALKTAGKQFDFADLYTSRNEFKEEILKVIGTDLNGFVLEDAAIDYLEQTPLEMLDEKNILDAEGIKKITELTAAQKILANEIEQNKDKTITKENVEAKEAILELNRQLAGKRGTPETGSGQHQGTRRSRSQEGFRRGKTKSRIGTHQHRTRTRDCRREQETANHRGGKEQTTHRGHRERTG